MVTAHPTSPGKTGGSTWGIWGKSGAFFKGSKQLCPGWPDCGNVAQFQTPLLRFHQSEDHAAGLPPSVGVRVCCVAFAKHHEPGMEFHARLTYLLLRIGIAYLHLTGRKNICGSLIGILMPHMARQSSCHHRCVDPRQKVAARWLLVSADCR